MLFTLTNKIIKYMKLEEQVTSLELSKRLKELGFEQNSLFYWQKWTQSDWKLSYHKDFDGINSKGQVELNGLEIIRDVSNDTDDACSAYTVVELGEMLPSEIKKDGEWLGDLETNKNATTWVITYRKVGFNVLHIEKEKTEADARAKMLIYLKENNLI